MEPQSLRLVCPERMCPENLFLLIMFADEVTNTNVVTGLNYKVEVYVVDTDQQSYTHSETVQ